MRRLLLTIFYCFTIPFLFGQTRQTDSIKQAIGTAKDQKVKLRAMIGLCERAETLPRDTLWNYALKAKALAVKLNDSHSFTLAIVAQANAYLRWNNADSARAILAPELVKYNPANPATRDIYFTLRQVNLNCISTNSDYKDAIAYVYSTMHDAEKYKDSLALARCMNSLSIYKYEMDFTGEAISWGIRGLSYTSNTPRYYVAVINLCGNLAEYYYWIVKLDSGMYYANRALELSQRTGFLNYQSWALQKRSAMYVKGKEYEKAEQAILESIKLDEKVDPNEPHDDNLMALADVYSRIKQYDKAIKVLTDGLAFYNAAQNISPHAKHDTGANNAQRIFYYQDLAKCYRQKGDLKNYSATLAKIITRMDAFYKANSAQDIADLETKYQVQKKEATIAQQQLALVREHYLFYSSVIIALLGAFIAILLFREARRKQAIKLQQLQDEERLLAEKAVADAEETERRRIAADLHDNLGAQLSFIKRNVDFIMDQPAGFSLEEERKYLSSVNDIAQSAMIDLRETIWVLNKDEVSMQEFVDKLKSYLRQQLMNKADIKWEFREHITESWKLSSGEVMHLFRIVQEVISNIIKHSGANMVNIQLQSDAPETYRLEIFDNGKGFETNTKYDGHYGLENIEQRAREISSTLMITSDEVDGTRIVLLKEKK